MTLILAVMLGLGVWVISYGPFDPYAAHGLEQRDEAAPPQGFALLDQDGAERPEADADG